MSASIQNSIALVTGSNRGIGRALVEGLLARGAAKVYAAARDTASVADLVATYGDRVVPVALDVTQPTQVAAAAAFASDATIVINNAGAAANPNLFGDDLEGARREFEVNYWGPLHVTRAFVPQLKGRPGATIATVSSIAGLTNFPLFPTYSDSKAAVHSLIVGSRLLLAADGIHVMGIYPGPVDTDMAKEITFPKATTADVAATVLDGIESGADEVFTDAMAQGYAAPYASGHKTLERQVASMLQPAA